MSGYVNVFHPGESGRGRHHACEIEAGVKRYDKVRKGLFRWKKTRRGDVRSTGSEGEIPVIPKSPAIFPADSTGPRFS